MTVSDCFRILGIPRTACLSDLKVAYRIKAKKYHPDRNGGDGKQFTLLHEAYTFLLDPENLQRGAFNPQAESQRRESEELKRRREFRKASEERNKREAAIKAEKEKRLAAEKAAFEKRRAAFEDKIKKSQLKAAKDRIKKVSKANSPSHKVFVNGEILKSSASEKQKLQAINNLISLKRKSAYPFLKISLYEGSENLILTSIAAIGKLNIIQAQPELSSLMCSGSIKIRLAVLDAIVEIGRKNQYIVIVNMALKDREFKVRSKAQDVFERVYG